MPRYLAAAEALATKAVRVYGQWARSVAVEKALEYVDAGGRRAYAARFRAATLAAGADCLGTTSLPATSTRPTPCGTRPPAPCGTSSRPGRRRAPGAARHGHLVWRGCSGGQGVGPTQSNIIDSVLP